MVMGPASHIIVVRLAASISVLMVQHAVKLKLNAGALEYPR